MTAGISPGRLVYFQAPPRSSSGPGHRPLKAEIIGSNPIRGTSVRTRAGTLEVMLLAPAPSLVFVIGLPAGLLISVIALGGAAWVLLGRISRG